MQESGVRSQESGVGSQESGVNLQFAICNLQFAIAPPPLRPSPLLQPVQRPQLAAEVGDQRCVLERAARHALDQLGRRVALAVAMDLIR